MLEQYDLIGNAELMQICWQEISVQDFLVTEPHLCEQKLLQFRAMIGSRTRGKKLNILLCTQKIMSILGVSNDTL